MILFKTNPLFYWFMEEKIKVCHSKRQFCMPSSRSLATEKNFDVGMSGLHCPHNRCICADTSCEHDEIVRKDYGSQLPRLEKRPSGVACQKDGSNSLPMKVTAIFLEHEIVYRGEFQVSQLSPQIFSAISETRK